MTWQILQYPTTANNMAGKVGCKGCNPYSGDTSCQESRPILCRKRWKVYWRVWYDYGPKESPSGYYNDNGFYNGWSGAVYRASAWIKGTELTSRSKADWFCYYYCGYGYEVAEFHDAYYTPYMNYPY